MNGIMKSTLRMSVLKNIVSPSAFIASGKTQLTRSLWNMCNRSNGEAGFLSTAKTHKSAELCNCGYYKGVHSGNILHTGNTQAGKELVEFLADEIVAEKKAQKLKTIPTEVDGFKVSLNGAEVSLVKKENDETITISFNVNHTVDTDTEPDLDPRSDKAELGEMKSKPTFEVDIVRRNQTLGLTCSFNNEAGASGADDSYNDIFGIDEITLYEGNNTEKVYAVAGEVIDACLYDLLMNYLEEKGISNEFAEKLIELSTSYEHTAYISLLEGLSKFASGN